MHVYLNLCENIKTFVPSLSLTSIKHITLLQFRNYSSASFSFNTPITCITGANGSGKTNLLDAAYYLCYTKSYFSAYQQNTVKNGTDGFRVEGIFEKNAQTEQIACKWKQGKKEVFTNGTEYDKPADHIGKYAAVMIAPDDMELINSGGELRRKWVDSILGQVDRTYLEKLLHYQKVLLQRNAWLKMQALKPSADRVALEYYNAQLADCGAYLYQCRKTFIADFIPLLQRFYHELSGGIETISIVYESDLQEKSLDKWFEECFQQDIRQQRTTRGVHRDDWDFNINGIAIKNFASQGQKKSFLFALKLAQHAYLNRVLGHMPILLLDDIFEKLDQNRMEALLRIIQGSEFGQVMLTDTHAERVRSAFGNAATINFIHL